MKMYLIDQAEYNGGTIILPNGAKSNLENWAECTANTENGNKYKVYWKINHPEEGPENACEWENPEFALLIDGKKAKENAYIDGKEIEIV